VLFDVLGNSIGDHLARRSDFGMDFGSDLAGAKCLELIVYVHDIWPVSLHPLPCSPEDGRFILRVYKLHNTLSANNSRMVTARSKKCRRAHA
jgi:hypothetical protein